MYRKQVKYTIVVFLIVLFCMTLLSCSQKAAEPDLAGETAKEAVKHYMEFLKKEDMYELTASPP